MWESKSPDWHQSLHLEVFFFLFSSSFTRAWHVSAALGFKAIACVQTSLHIKHPSYSRLWLIYPKHIDISFLFPSLLPPPSPPLHLLRVLTQIRNALLHLSFPIWLFSSCSTISIYLYFFPLLLLKSRVAFARHSCVPNRCRSLSIVSFSLCTAHIIDSVTPSLHRAARR